MDSHTSWALTRLFCSPSCAQLDQRVCLSSPVCCWWGWMRHCWGCWCAHGGPRTSACGHHRSEERKQPHRRCECGPISRGHICTLLCISLFLSSFVLYSVRVKHALIKTAFEINMTGLSLSHNFLCCCQSACVCGSAWICVQVKKGVREREMVSVSVYLKSESIVWLHFCVKWQLLYISPK